MSRKVLHPSELSEEMKAELQTAKMDSKHDHLNELMTEDVNKYLQKG